LSNFLAKTISTDSANLESGANDPTSGGAMSSKWKLLKTLKERKIEEKNNQEKIKEEEASNKDKEKVSFDGFLVKFLGVWFP
jgi:protein unc-13